MMLKLRHRRSRAGCYFPTKVQIRKKLGPKPSEHEKGSENADEIAIVTRPVARLNEGRGSGGEDDYNFKVVQKTRHGNRNAPARHLH